MFEEGERRGGGRGEWADSGLVGEVGGGEEALVEVVEGVWGGLDAREEKGEGCDMLG